MKSRRNLVLYVEDEENDVFLVQYGFEKAGLCVPLHVATTGREAQAYLTATGEYADRNAHPFPSLVLLDVNLPVMTGLELLEWARAQDHLRDLPIVMFSSSAHPRDQARARELGASDYLLKPGEAHKFVELARHLKERWPTQLA